MVPVNPLARSEAVNAAALATSASVVKRRVWVRLARPSCHCSQVMVLAALRLKIS